MSANKSWIIIVTYNGVKWINKCLNSCNNYNVVVVDNNSSDETVKRIKENFSDVILLPQSKNLGFGAANNIGISYALNAGADYLFLLNQDAYLKKGTIERLVEVHKSNSTFGILSPIHLNGDASKLDRNFSHYISYDKNASLISDFVIGNKRQNIYEVPFVNAAAWLLPKRTLLTVGGFDPLFFHYGEDDHYCQRALFHDLKIGVVPEAFVLHDRENRKGQSLTKFSDSYFKLRLKQYKYKYANVNNSNWKTELKTELKSLKNTRIKQLIKFKWGTARGYNRLYKALNDQVDEIKESRMLVAQKGAHYLTLNQN